MKILCFGSMNIDKVYQVEHICRPGETISSAGYGVFPGGKGLNQSVAAAKAGAECFHAGAVGFDGELLLETLRNAGVDTSFIEQMTDCPSGHTIIQVDANGQNCIIVDGGTNHRIADSRVDEVLRHFTPEDAILLQNELGNVGYIMQKAGEKGMRVIFNPSPVTEKIMDYPLAYVDIFLINEIEGEYLTGETVPEKILAKLKTEYPNASVLLTLGEKGSIFDDGNGVIRMESCRVHAKDTTAAGDTFTGYFIAGLAAGKTVKESLSIASAAAAISVSREGAASSIPFMNEVAAFMEERKN